MKPAVLFLLFFLAFGQSSAQRQYDWNDHVQAIYESITSLRIPEARKLILVEKLKSPNNLAYALLDSYADLYQLFFNESTSDYNNLYPQFEKRINLLKEGPKNSPFHLYSLGLLHLHKAVAAVRFDRNWEAALDFRKAYFNFKDNSKLYPSFSPNNLYFVLLTTLIGSAPSNYQWMLNILGFNGNIIKGNELVLSYINSKDEYAKICLNEALLIYPYLIMNFEGNAKKTFDFIEQNNYDFKKNHIHAYMATNLYLNHQNSTRALEIANGIEMTPAYLNIPFWHYEKGFAYFNQMKFDLAQKEFLYFTSQFKGNFFIKDAFEKLSCIALLQNNMKQALLYRKELQTKGSEITDADKLAQQNANTGLWPNPVLLKARILSDGGFQKQALITLADKTTLDFNSPSDKAEFPYRLARIYDILGDHELAIKYYKSTIQKGEGLPEYFASRAALQIGLIYEADKKYKDAIDFYNTCISMKNHAFKNSMDQKAKSGILRCKRN
ncbi:MAG: tetratricopeptide repeat protein [Sediminibacterium sp.]